MLDIVLATSNRHKARELKALLAVPGIRWRSLAEFPSVPPVRETGRTFEANAIRKAVAIARATGHAALADDSGLEVNALHSAPGVRSARFAGGHGDTRANNEALLRRLRGVPPKRRSAAYRCVLVLATPSGVAAVTRGVWRGRIAEQPRGRRGFGYDPLFFLPRLGKTAGQVPSTVKKRLSHRARAARAMRAVLRRLDRGERAWRVTRPPRPDGSGRGSRGPQPPAADDGDSPARRGRRGGAAGRRLRLRHSHRRPTFGGYPASVAGPATPVRSR